MCRMLQQCSRYKSERENDNEFKVWQLGLWLSIREKLMVGLKFLSLDLWYY